MRKKHDPAPSEGDTRTVKEFLLWPLRIKNETRWLEMAVIMQEYSRTGMYSCGWVNLFFVDNYDD